MNRFSSTLIVLLTCVTVALMTGCKGQTDASNAVSADSMKYAELLQIEQRDGYRLVSVKDPWKTGENLHVYALVNRGNDVPADIPAEATVVEVPLQKMCVSTSVHSSLFLELGAIDNVGSVCDANYILNKQLVEMVGSGKIADVGSSMNPSVEKIVACKTDALLMSPFEGASYGLLEKTGLPIIECADYMETSVLGRAEWMKFYGMLVGKENEAAALFAEIEQSYNSLKTMVEKEHSHPSLMVDMLSGPTWYVPGGSSTYGTLYAEAGANYLQGEAGVSGSQPLSLEKVVTIAKDADVWLLRYGGAVDMTYESLAKENAAYTMFAPYNNRKIYGCNTMTVPFYDEVPFHPDYLMNDVVKILYPNLLPAYELRYYTPLK